MESSPTKREGPRKTEEMGCPELGLMDEIQKCYKEIEHLKQVNQQLVERYEGTVSIVKTAVGNLATLGPSLTKEELNDLFAQLSDMVKKL